MKIKSLFSGWEDEPIQEMLELRGHRLDLLVQVDHLNGQIQHAKTNQEIHDLYSEANAIIEQAQEVEARLKALGQTERRERADLWFKRARREKWFIWWQALMSVTFCFLFVQDMAQGDYWMAAVNWMLAFFYPTWFMRRSASQMATYEQWGYEALKEVPRDPLGRIR